MRLTLDPPLLAGLVAAAFGGGALLGHAAGIPALTVYFDGLPPIQPVTALMVLLTAAALIVRSARFERSVEIARAIATLVAAVGVLVLVDTWLSPASEFPRREPVPWLGEISPGRMADIAALSCVLFGLAIWAPSRSSVVTATVGLVIIAVPSIGYLLDVHSFRGLGMNLAISVPALCGFLAAFIGVLSLHPRTGWVRLVSRRTRLARSTRSLIAWVIIVPLVLAWLALKGEQAGFYGEGLRFALVTLGTLISLVVLVLFHSARVDRLERERRTSDAAMRLSEHRLRLATHATGVGIWDANLSTGGIYLSDEARKILGLESVPNVDRDTLNACIHPADLPAALRQARAVIEPGGSDHFEIEVRILTGNAAGPDEQWVEIEGMAVRRDGNALRLVGTMLDISQRKAVVRALAESEERLNLATAALQGYTYDWDCTTNEVTRSAGFEELLGYSPSETGDASWWRSCIVRDHATPSLAAKLASSGEEVTSANSEYAVRSASGELIWVWDHAILLRGPDGQLRRIVGNVIDITAKKTAEALLRKSEARFRAISDAISDIVWTSDAEGNMSAGQESWSALTGQSEEAYRDHGWTSALHPDDVRPTLDAWQKAVALQAPFGLEHRIRRPSGEYRRYMLRAVPVRNEAGSVIEWVGVHTDVTDQRAAEQHLEEAMRRLELAIQAADIGMWDWNVETGEIQWSAQCRQILGTGDGQTPRTERAFVDLVHPDDVDLVRQVTDIIDDGVSTHFEREFRFIRRDGEVRWAENRAGIIRDPETGRALRVIGTLVDLTKSKRLEAEREALLVAERAARNETERVSKLKDEFLATMSHELRTPLNAIMGWLLLLRKPNASPELWADGLRVIERNVKAQTRLITDLFDVNRLMSGKLSLELQPVDINEVVRGALESVTPSANDKGVLLRADLGESLPMVEGDARRLQQVVLNLLTNGIKFTPPGGQVAVESSTSNGLVVVSVRDSGEGIAADLLPQLFQTFRQGDSSTSRRHGGLGLGLAISRQLMEMHGGSIEARSAGPGQGATFTVRMPPLMSASDRLLDDSGINSSSAIQPGSLAGMRILAVDDQPDALEYLSRLLEQQGACVCAVSSAGDALDSLRSPEDGFDVLISDIGMPGITGYDLIHTIRHKLHMDEHKLPAIALTAFAREEDRIRCLELGYQLHMPKPVQVFELITSIREIIASRAA